MNKLRQSPKLNSHHAFASIHISRFDALNLAIPLSLFIIRSFPLFPSLLVIPINIHPIPSFFLHSTSIHFTVWPTFRISDSQFVSLFFVIFFWNGASSVQIHLHRPLFASFGHFLPTGWGTHLLHIPLRSNFTLICLIKSHTLFFFYWIGDCSNVIPVQAYGRAKLRPSGIYRRSRILYSQFLGFP